MICKTTPRPMECPVATMGYVDTAVLSAVMRGEKTAEELDASAFSYPAGTDGTIASVENVGVMPRDVIQAMDFKSYAEAIAAANAEE